MNRAVASRTQSDGPSFGGAADEFFVRFCSFFSFFSSSMIRVDASSYLERYSVLAVHSLVEDALHERYCSDCPVLWGA